ncbi:MAG: cysteine desulfurase family protein [Acidimicrobiales bacterium]
MTVYLDHAATTPMRPEVLEAMEPYLKEDFGNPSGAHAAARTARRALDDARERLAAVLGCEPGEIVFTSGGTEADNLAVTGSALHAIGEGAAAPLVCCSAVEHPAVIEPVRFLGGLELPVGPSGVIDLEMLRAVLEVEQDRVVLVSVMLANNETGVVEPVADVAALVHASVRGALVHTDAVQALAWLDLRSESAPADLVTVSAHKIGGPKGVGALVARGEARGQLSPIIRGGPQERELRAGTPNLPGIVGFAVAAELADAERSEATRRAGELGGRLLAGIMTLVPDAAPAVKGAERLASIVSLGFPGVDSEEMLLLLDQQGVAASAGSACASGAIEPSPVLLAMGLTTREARSHVRFSLGRSTTEAEVDLAIKAVGGAVEHLRS